MVCGSILEAWAEARKHWPERRPWATPLKGASVMKIECNEVPQPPVKTYTLTLSEREMRLLAAAANLSRPSFDSASIVKDFYLQSGWRDYCELVTYILGRAR